MATKKIKAEVELDISKAKRKAKELEQPGSGTPGGASVATSTPKAADKLSESLNRASKSADKFGEKAKESSARISHVVKSFAGIGAGMALNYAANNMKYGGKRDAVEYVGNTLVGAGAGAAAGAPLGPPGAIVGAIAGGIGGFLKTFFDKDSAKEKTIEDFEKSEKIYAGAKAKQERFEELTDVKPSQYGESLVGLRENLKNFEESVNVFVEKIRDELKKSSPDYDRIEDLRRNLSYSRSMVDQYKKAIKNIEKAQESITDQRASISGTDSLHKIGMADDNPESLAYSASKESEAAAGAPATKNAATPVINIPAISGFSVPAKAFSEMKFFQTPRSDWSEKATNEAIQRIDGEQLKVLQSIEQKIGKGGSSWQ